MSEENNLLLKKIVEARILKKFVLNNSKEKTEQALLTLHNKIERKSIWSILRPYLGYVLSFFCLSFRLYWEVSTILLRTNTLVLL